MTIEQKKTILQRIVDLSTDINTLKKARVELATSGYASATLSSGGGSKSYTKIDIDKISKLIKELNNELLQLRNMLKNNGDVKVFETTEIIYS